MINKNPVLVEVCRGGLVESRHRGAFVVANESGSIMASAGDIEATIFPRSAIKAFQALPFLERGGAAQFGFDDKEIALCCASHGGEPEHVSTVTAMLAKTGFTIADLECGAHPPMNLKAANELVANGISPDARHNNCSGKHAGMLAMCKILGVDHTGYSRVDHPVQQHIKALMSEFFGDLEHAPCGIDGCSVPNWAISLKSVALAWTRFCSGSDMSADRFEACQQMIKAAKQQPFMIAGSDRFCSNLMTALPRLFVKTGAEGYFSACIADLNIGIALKCDDGATRASEIMLANVLYQLDILEPSEQVTLKDFIRVELKNFRDLSVGEIRAVSNILKPAL